jgi:hypothetical protein
MNRPPGFYRGGVRHIGYLVNRDPRSASSVNGTDLQKRISYLVKLIFDDDWDRSARFHRLIMDQGLKAHVLCFWHGKAGAHAGIPEFIIGAFKGCPPRSKSISTPIEPGELATIGSTSERLIMSEIKQAPGP